MKGLRSGYYRGPLVTIDAGVITADDVTGLDLPDSQLQPLLAAIKERDETAAEIINYTARLADCERLATEAAEAAEIGPKMDVMQAALSRVSLAQINGITAEIHQRLAALELVLDKANGRIAACLNVVNEAWMRARPAGPVVVIDTDEKADWFEKIQSERKKLLQGV